MKDVEHLNYSINQHFKKIKEHSDSKKIMQLFQTISEYSVKSAGMSFLNNKSMARLLKVSVRSIQRFTKKLEDLLILMKIPTNRKHNRGQTSNTYVILPVLKSTVKSLYDKVCHGGCHPLNPSLKPLKQESNSIISIDKKIIENPQTNIEKLQNIFGYKLKDIIDNKKSIQYPSSFIDSWLRRMKKEADAFERRKNRQSRQKTEQPRTIIPFYNWLDGNKKPVAKNPDFDKAVLNELDIF